MPKCKLCGMDLPYGDEYELHIKDCHSMTYREYYEFTKSVKENICICGNELYRVSPWFEIYNPCPECLSNKMYTESVLMNINKIYNIICNNKYIKLFILNENLRYRITDFNILDYCNSLNFKYNKIDKINLFEVKTKLGLNPNIYPSLNNIEINKSKYSIKLKELVICNNSYCKFKIGSDEFKLLFPEECEYHNGSHYKYNILNRGNSPQSSKKLLLSSGTCIKLHNTCIDVCKSLLKVSKNGTEIYSSSLTESEIDYIKFYIITNSNLLRYLFNILQEIMKNSRYITDKVFLLNRLLINPIGKFNMNIDWTVNNKMLSEDPLTLNISIL